MTTLCDIKQITLRTVYDSSVLLVSTLHRTLHNDGEFGKNSA